MIRRSRILLQLTVLFAVSTASVSATDTQNAPASGPPNLIEDFDSYSTGLLENLGTDWTVNRPAYYTVTDGGGGNNYLTCLDDDGANTDPSLKPLGENEIAEGDTGTFFSRVYYDGAANGSLWFGLATSGGSGFNAFLGYLSFSSTGEIRIRDGADFRTATVSLATNTWHNFWVIHNNETDTIQVFMTTENRDATHEDRLADASGQFEFAFRNSTTGSINQVQVINRTTTGAWGIDELFMSTGANLALPTLDGPRCAITCSHPAVAVGGTVTLSWTASDIPAASTFEISSNATVTVLSGSLTGDATPESGQVELMIDSASTDPVQFSMTVSDSSAATISESQTQAELFDYSAPAQLPHPSVTSSQGQLSHMRDQVLNHPGSLAKAGWDAMQATSWASLSYVHTPQQIIEVVPGSSNASERNFRSDTTAVRAHALQWVVTENPAHRDKALAILNDMGRTFDDMVSTGNPMQVSLESAWALPVWLSAADIMRYHNDGAANWDPADMASFHRFARKLYEYSRWALHYRNNWGVSTSFAVMAYGAWSDDPAIFQDGLDNQLGRLDILSETSGRIAETCRDTWHPQYSIVTWIDAAELARNLGHLELYEATFDAQSTPRLAIILEYFANLMLGNTTHPCAGSWSYDYLGEYDRFDNYEVAYNHYINRKEVAYLPIFSEMIEDFWRNNVGDDSHFLLWSRLTHGDNTYDALPPPDTYEQWAAAQFAAHGITDPGLIAPGADYNQDGIPNSLHYWSLTDPRENNGEAVFSTAPTQGPAGMRLRFIERTEAATYGRIFLHSAHLDASLESWTEVTPESIDLAEDRGDQVIREATFPRNDDSGFYRLSYPDP